MPTRAAAKCQTIDIEAKGRVWLDCCGEAVLGPGRADLLEAIIREGSIAAAARQLGMSYRKAWNLVDAMNRAAWTPLVEAGAGGSTGGGATLTPSGLALLDVYRDLDQQLLQLCAQAQQALAAVATSGPKRAGKSTERPGKVVGKGTAP